MILPAETAVGNVVRVLIDSKSYRATKYLSPKLVVNATRKLYGRKVENERYGIDVILTIGRPNYRQRKFIKQCVKAGEPFPVKKIHLQQPPKER